MRKNSKNKRFLIHAFLAVSKFDQFIYNSYHYATTSRNIFNLGGIFFIRSKISEHQGKAGEAQFRRNFFFTQGTSNHVLGNDNKLFCLLASF